MRGGELVGSTVEKEGVKQVNKGQRPKPGAGNSIPRTPIKKPSVVASVTPAILLQDGKQNQKNCPEGHGLPSAQCHRNKTDPASTRWEARTES